MPAATGFLSLAPTNSLQCTPLLYYVRVLAPTPRQQKGFHGLVYAAVCSQSRERYHHIITTSARGAIEMAAGIICSVAGAGKMRDSDDT